MSDFAEDTNVPTKSGTYKQRSACEETCLRMVRYCQNCRGEDGGERMNEDKTLKEIALALLEKYRTVAEALIYENSGRITEDLMEADCEYGRIRKQIEKAAEPEIIYCKDCRHNGSFDTDCPINWNGKEYCNFAE